MNDYVSQFDPALTDYLDAINKNIDGLPANKPLRLRKTQLGFNIGIGLWHNQIKPKVGLWTISFLFWTWYIKTENFND